MSERYPGGIISKTPPTVTGPATSGPLAGEGGSASGVWTLADVLTNRKIGIWPTPVLPRSLWTWGLNSSGQLGSNTVVDRSSPVQVGALTTWAQVSVGGKSTAAVKSDGTLWAWGYNKDGAIGDNTTVSRSSPVQIGALTTWTQVSAGNNFTAAIKTDKTLWTWGNNSPYGPLGQNDITNRSSPVQVGALTNWSQVSAGNTHTAAVKTDGTLWTWGRNNRGQLGDGTITDKSSPIQVGALTTWSQVSAGVNGANTQSTAAVKTDGTLWAWGINSNGQLGDGTVIARSSPVQVGALTTWSQVSTGSRSAAAVKTDGTLWAWGYNNAGQLGTTNVISRSSPVQVGALTNWLQVSAGSYSAAAVKTNGTLWAWGGNDSGQLGTTNVISRSSPVQVGALTNWSQVSAGNGFTAATYKG